MKHLFKQAVLGTALAASAMAVATPAEAQRYRHYGRYHDHTGAYLATGIAGLAIGAALASSANDPNRDGWYRDRGYRYDYDDFYYRDRGYYPADGYYAYRYRDYGRCYTERRYDPYYERRVKIRVCD